MCKKSFVDTMLGPTDQTVTCCMYQEMRIFPIKLKFFDLTEVETQEKCGLIFVTQKKAISDGALAGLPILISEVQKVFDYSTLVDEANQKILPETAREGHYIKALQMNLLSLWLR